MPPSLINANAAPETLYVDMRRSIRASAAPKSGADSEGEMVTTATDILTAHIVNRRPPRLRIIVFAPIITIRLCGRVQPERRRAHRSRWVRALLKPDMMGRFLRFERGLSNDCYWRNGVI
jgi:hypothetical protein